MNEYVSFVQGGQQIVIFTKHIICITEAINGCDIHLSEMEEPIKTGKKVNEILQLLNED